MCLWIGTILAVHEFEKKDMGSLVFYLLITVAHNCHIKTKCSQQIKNRSHQIQIAHIKFKSLTANSNRSQQISNRSQQIQIAHSKFKSLTANYKSLPANSNRPQQIQIVHSKFKSLTANSNCSHQITNHYLRYSCGSLIVVL